MRVSKKVEGMPVSEATVGNVTYIVSMLGVGYRVVYTTNRTDFVEIDFGLRDGVQAERKAKAFHKKTFGEWPKSVKFRQLF